MNVSLANKLMVDVASHLGEGVMVKDDCIEHEDLCYEQLSKSTTFEPPPRVDPPCGPPRRAARRPTCTGTYTRVHLVPICVTVIGTEIRSTPLTVSRIPSFRLCLYRVWPRRPGDRPNTSWSRHDHTTTPPLHSILHFSSSRRARSDLCRQSRA
jgi:hypothetical protein